MTARRSALAILAAGAGLVALLLAGADAEAISRARARINWSSDLPLNLADRSKILTDLPEATREAFQSEPLVFFLRNTLSRQSNPDPLATPVVPGATFEDRLTFVASVDVEDAVLRIHQPAYGLDQDECHVVVTSVTDRDGNPVGEAIPAAGATQVELGLLEAAQSPFEVAILSQIPSGSQLSTGRLTPRTLTSTIRIGQRVPSRARVVAGAVPTPTPRRQPCSGDIGGRGFSSLVYAVVVRTQLDGRQWALRNGRATPTVIPAR